MWWYIEGKVPKSNITKNWTPLFEWLSVNLRTNKKTNVFVNGS